jgi:hypothetical protein
VCVVCVRACIRTGVVCVCVRACVRTGFTAFVVLVGGPPLQACCPGHCACMRVRVRVCACVCTARAMESGLEEALGAAKPCTARVLYRASSRLLHHSWGPSGRPSRQRQHAHNQSQPITTNHNQSQPIDPKQQPITTNDNQSTQNNNQSLPINPKQQRLKQQHCSCKAQGAAGGAQTSTSRETHQLIHKLHNPHRNGTAPDRGMPSQLSYSRAHQLLLWQIEAGRVRH